MSDERRHRRALWKGAALYAGAAGFCILFDNVYAVFGHGVRSAAMSWMFLGPLLGAALAVILALRWPAVREKRLWPVVKNLFAGGIAVLTMGGLLKGVLDIAGTASSYIVWYTVVGGALVALSLLVGIIMRLRPD